MKRLIIVGLISVLLGIFGVKGTAQKANPSFKEQLNTFRELGFLLNDGVDTSDINRWGDGHSEFEEEPYILMYVTLGQTIEEEPWTPLTNKCWHFDTEAIYGNGSYIEIMENLSRITNGEMIFENLQDSVDIDSNIAWVSFICKGKKYKWDLKIQDDWVDVDLFEKVKDLTQKYRTKGKYTLLTTGGQDVVFGYYTPEELKKLKDATGLEIDWL